MVLVTQCQRVEKALIDGPGAAVSVRVVRATGLLAADKGGTSDPFVTVLSKGSKKAKTSVKKKTLEPEWDETLDLTVHDLAAPLSLTVFDHDKGAKNDNLGSAEITGLSEIEPGVPTPYKVALSKQGAVEVVVTLEYRVSVHVVRAKDLLAADKNGKSDPYVVVQSAGGKKAKTSVKKKTLEPEWDETLDLTVHDLAAPLSLTVFDHDKGAKNDNLGSAEITGLSEIEPGVPTPYKVALSKQGAVEVVVTLEYRVSVHVVRAKDLLAADKNGKSDPYVVVQSAGGKKAKTSVKKKTLEPEWDETLDLTVPDLAAPLSLTVMDYDKVCTPNPHPEPSPGPNFAPVRNSARDPNPYPDPNPTLDHDTIGITD